LTEQHGEGRVRSLAEAVLFYVGIPAALLYPLGVLGVGLQMSQDPLFPYSRLDTDARVLEGTHQEHVRDTRQVGLVLIPL